MEPDELVEVPGSPHTFALAGARQMLRKLEWEMSELARPDAFTVFRAFNVAVTAWHLVDWTWHDLPDHRRSAWKGEFKRFRACCETQCPSVRLCGFVADASKHDGPDRNRRDQPVVTLSSADVMRAKCGVARCGDPLSTWTWRLIIRDDRHEYAAADVFSRALEFWREIIEREITEDAAPSG
jgi:hypothetical protein